MATDVIMPQMGESIFEGTITKWLKKPGDKVERDEPLFEISTDKVDAEIPSPSAGVLKEIKVTEGQTVPIQTVVAVIDAAGATAALPAPAAAPKPEAAKPAVGAPATTKAEPPQPAAPPPPKPTPGPPASAAPQRAGGNGDKIRSSPLVRRIARENNIDLSQVSGTGVGGRISKRDIMAAVEGSSAAPADPPSAVPSTPPAVLRETPITSVPREKMYFGHYEVQPMSTMRQKIAEHMVLSKRTS